jgi:hypothetical protein
MDPNQIAERCPTAELAGVGYLPEYELCFPRFSKSRQCGVSSVSRRSGSLTWGVVFRLSAGDLQRLDAYEGFRADRDASANSYNRVEVEVVMNAQPTSVITYIATPQTKPPGPSAGYLKHLQDGARYYKLPAEYIVFLDGIGSVSV